MAGLIEGLFPESVQETGRRFGMGLKAAGRGLETNITGGVDLLGLPLTLSGLVKPENVIGSTEWADKHGLIIPKQKGANKAEQFYLDSIEAGAGLFGGAKIGGMVNRAVGDTPVPGASATANRDIPATRGQITNSAKDMDNEAKLAVDPKYAQAVREWTNSQHDRAKSTIEGFARSIGSPKMDDAQFGNAIRQNFDLWFDGIKKTHQGKTKQLYDAALNTKGAREELPTVGMTQFDDFLNDVINTGTPDKYVALLADVEKSARAIGEAPIDMRGLHQQRQELNNAFKIDKMKPGPYDAAGKDMTDRATALLKRIADERLDIAIAHGSPEVQASGAALKRANHVFGVTTNNLQRIQDETINRLLGREEGRQLAGEDIVKRFKNMKPSERQFFNAVANKVNPEMANELRASLVDDLYNSGKRVGGSSGQSDYDVAKFVTKFDNMSKDNPEILDFITGSDPKVRENLNSIVTQAKQAINTGPTLKDTSVSGAIGNVVAGTVGAVTGQIGAARAAAGSFGVLTNIGEKLFGTKEKLFNSLYNGVDNKALDAVPTPMPGNMAAEGVLAAGAGQAAGMAQDMVQNPNAVVAPPVASESMPDADMEVDPADLQWDASKPDVDPDDLKW